MAFSITIRNDRADEVVKDIDSITHSSPPAKLNELVDQAVEFQKLFIHGDAQIQCNLGDDDLLIAPDAKQVNEALFYLLESTINALIHLPHDPSVSGKVTISTGRKDEHHAFLDVSSEYIPASDPKRDVWDGTFNANLVLRQGRARAERIFESIGGRMVMGTFKGASALAQNVSVELPLWTNSEYRTELGQHADSTF